ncbi:MAG TPA: 50S ribosomal protein L25 [Parachlamydiales bacterium]|nr:50S ribosomal protein L25 [Parachlamydiales bacterium]
MIMKLSLFARASGKKSEIKKIRREGNVPGVLYGVKQEAKNIYIQGAELDAVFRTLKAGLLSTTVFTLQEGDKTLKALVKDIHYHPTTYAVQHIDFLMLEDNTPVSVNVPIVVLGASECPGIKLGGFSRQVIRHLEVRCLPKHIPQQFSLSIHDLQLSQAKRLSDIEVPASVRPLAKNMKEVAIVIAKR